MKTDRELLVDAARAAGIGLVAWTKFFDEWKFACNPCGEPWNPLIEDGDAFRLAVKLNLTIGKDIRSDDAGVIWLQENELRRISEPYGGDPYAATRRAIVRAAAEIGGAA